MRILYAYNLHRGGGGSNDSMMRTIGVARDQGWEVQEFGRSSRALPRNLWGRLQAGTSAIYAPASVRAFAETLDRFRPDIVHAYDLFPLVSPWILPECTRRGIAVVMSTDDYRITCPNRTHLHEGEICTQCVGGREFRAIVNNCRGNWAESAVSATYNTMVRKLGLFSKHVGVYVAPSEFCRQWLLDKAGLAPDKVHILAPIVTVEGGTVDPSQGEYAGYAGRFVPEKGIRIFARAASLSGLPFALTRNRNHFVVTEAPGDLRVVVTSSREELMDFYRKARVIVMPSLWFETFGVVGAEAMSLGVPVIGSRIGAVAELIDDGVDGFLFEPGNARDLADKVSRLWNDPELCRRMGAAAHAKSARWTRVEHVGELKRIYGVALASAAR